MELVNEKGKFSKRKTNVGVYTFIYKGLILFLVYHISFFETLIFIYYNFLSLFQLSSILG